MPDKKALEQPFILEDDEELIEACHTLVAASYLLGQFHAEEEIPPGQRKKLNAADEDEKILAKAGNITIKNGKVPFAEAIDFLKSKVPMTKDGWNALDQKLRFRAFTVAKLGTATEIETAKQILADAVEKGESYAQSWETLKAALDGSATFKPGYWETVFRTNTQSAYTAAKLAKYEDTGAVAYQLMVVEDERTSKICRHLLVESGYGAILPIGHNFWKKYGFPPYHFNCRTSICPVYQSEIGTPGYNVENIPMKRFSKFKPQDGFGGNPLERGNWWMMTPSQMEQAIKYGILNMFNRQENVFADYDSVWKGYTRHEGKNGGWYDLWKNPPDDWETKNKPVVEFLAEHGYHIKVIPDLKNILEKYSVEWSNPDVILNGFLSDIKTPEKLDSSGIKSRLRSAVDQGLTHVILNIPDDMPESEIRRGFNRFKGEKHSVVLKVLWVYKGVISSISV